MQKKSECLFD